MQTVRRLHECQETGSLLGNHADKFMAALKAYWASHTNLHQKCLKQIKARSNNGDFETRLSRGDDSVGAALLAPYFARKDRRVHCQSRRRGVAAAHHRREVFYVCFVDWVRLLHEHVSRWSWIQTSTLSVCDVLKHCWSVHQSRDSSDGWANGARGIQLGCTGAVSGCWKKRNCEVDRVESFVVSFR